LRAPVGAAIVDLLRMARFNLTAMWTMSDKELAIFILNVAIMAELAVLVV